MPYRPNFDYSVPEGVTRRQRESLYRTLAEQASLRGEEAYRAMSRGLAMGDLYYLLVYILNRRDVLATEKTAEFVFARCVEFQRDPDWHIDLWARGHFKAVDIKEPVPTPVGFVEHGHLRPGWEVFDSNGNPCSVVAKTEVFTNADCYKVCFGDGYEVVVSGDHRWMVDFQDRRRVGGGTNNKRRGWKSVEVDTRALLEEVRLAQKNSTRRYPRIKVAPPVYYECQDLPVHPYVLGAWLGDGTKNGTSITSGLVDVDEMMGLLAGCGIEVHRTTHSNSASIRIGSGVRSKRTSSDFANGLRKLGIYGDKRIPEKYLRSSIEQRWALLQGLMDTDGSCNLAAKSQCILCSAIPELAHDVFLLCQSLGLKPTLKKRHGKYKGEDRPFWQVQFRGYAENSPFKLKRKTAKLLEGFGPLYRQVKKVEPVEPRPVSCIQVDSEDGCYLIGENHVKTHNSSLITVAYTIQEILSNPGLTFCIFSITRPIAKGFLREIKQEFQTNEKLKALFPDVLYQSPNGQSPKWSENEGLVVKRKENKVESTVEAWGLVDGMPTSRHFDRLIYDDVVTERSVNTPEMMQQAVDKWRLSLNLVSQNYKVRYIGTRYHMNDLYGHLLREGVATPRLYPATDDGTPSGKPIMLSEDEFNKRYAQMGSYVASCQLLQNPKADDVSGFNYKDLRYWRPKDLHRLNIYILVDPANEKKTTSDYTAMWVIGLGTDKNYYVIDVLRDRLNLTERTQRLMEWIRLYSPVRVGYEKYGLQADVQHIEYVMDVENFRYSGKIIELGGSMPKTNRIRQMEPIIEGHRLFLPEYCHYTDYQGKKQDLIKVFIDEELVPFPVPNHDDMLDALQRILHEDLNAQFPPLEPISESMTQAERDALTVRGLLSQNPVNIEDGFEGIDAYGV